MRFLAAWKGLSTHERLRLAGMFGVVALLHIVGFGVLIAVIAPHHYAMGTGQVLGLGLGVTVYSLGLRHAFDADHICAIDNTTRMLTAQGKRPMSIGFFFSLGHSSVVFFTTFILAAGIKVLVGTVADDNSSIHQTLGTIGTSVSGGFLYMIGIINVVALIGIIKVWKEMKAGRFDEDELEKQLNARGFLNRILGRFMRTIDKEWKMFPIGLLFGIGFDTATEVTLIAFAGGAAAVGLPILVVMVLPVIFAAGMSLFDTLDGCFMNFAYGWAFNSPVRKIYYNIIMTGISVMVAILVGSLELIQVASTELHFHGALWGFLSGIDMNMWGYVIVGLFVVTWASAMIYWRVSHVEERWRHAVAG